MSTKYLPPAFDSGLPPVGGPADLEINAVLTTSGYLAMVGAAITYEPGLDARLLGRGALVIPVEDLIALSRRDGNRRLVLGVGAQEFVFRGVGAQRVWVALMALREDHGGGPHLPPMIFEEKAARVDDRNGLYAIGAHGYGYAGRLPVGLVVSFWEELGALRSIHSEGAMIVRGAEERSIHGVGAAAFVAALSDRWLEATAGPASEHGWRVRAALHSDGEVTFGVLSIETPGVVFTPVEGPPRVLAARGGRSVAWVRAADERELHIEDDRAAHRLRALDATALGTALTAMFVSSAWRCGTPVLLHQALPDDQITLLYGLCSSGLLSHQGTIVAHAGQQLLKPNAYEVEVDVVTDQTPLPALPFPCDLEVASPRGRFGVRCVAASIAPRPLQPGDDPTRVARFGVQVRFRGEVLPINRRDYFRLGVDAPVHRAEFVVAEERRVLTRGVRLVNVSHRGCRVVAPVAPDIHTPCLLQVEFDEHLVTVSGKVVNISQVDRESWQVGIAYSAESVEPGSKVFLERQTAFLRKRHVG